VQKHRLEHLLTKSKELSKIVAFISIEVGVLYCAGQAVITIVKACSIFLNRGE